MSGKQLDTAIETLQLIGRYTSGEYEEVELSGNAEALKDLSSRLSFSTDSQTMTLYNPDNVNPAPYMHFLTALHVKQTGGRVIIKVENDMLCIEGSGTHLSQIAHQIANMVSDTCSSHHLVLPHLHIEYYPDHLYLDNLSLPLVIVFNSSVSLDK